MLNHLDPASALAVGLLVFSMIMVIMFEATNGFHDAANAVATVIYTKLLKPGQATSCSQACSISRCVPGRRYRRPPTRSWNSSPAEVLSPPDGGPAVAMLLSLFIAALFWYIGNWWLGIAQFEFALPDRRR